jgi:GNAT superfamily N-acetyltransferase
MIDVRPAGPDDLPHLPEIERAADTVFTTIGIEGLPSAAPAEDYADAAAVLVVGNPPVGFARVELKCGEAYLDQLSVHPSAMGQGVGSALLDAAVAWAAHHGHDSMFLATFRDVAWNAPFYARHGFIEVVATTAGMREVEEHERALRMERFGPRVLMRRAWPPQ